MKFALVGVGGAGGRVVNALRNVEQNSDRAFTNDQLLVFDTEQAAFEEFTAVPPARHVLIGDTHPDIRGEGLDGDVDLGAAVAEEDTDEIYREFDKLATHEVHATLFVA
ncbi:MAG: cell division protein FtsZ, partial [Natrialbaceae archaeon]